ncbi:MAG: hypothetical protein U9R75_00895 [Candidatus Thermoplasmatota archaeon]|nr:hypothetical protein [Candidatus Thermoplasmatota archaeon]
MIYPYRKELVASTNPSSDNEPMVFTVTNRVIGVVMSGNRPANIMN